MSATILYFLKLTGGDTRGLTAYNHNLDTSREFYPTVSTHPREIMIRN